MPSKSTIFQHYRKSLERAGLSTICENSLICPLCWNECPYDLLSMEHIVPGSVGGTSQILTCIKCNNEHGTRLDAHLAGFQTDSDSFKGKGVFAAELIINEKKVAAELEWANGAKNFTIIEKASNPRNIAAIQQDFKDGIVSQLNVKFRYSYNKNRMHLAVLRCAYLILFKCHGYEYAKHSVIQTVRKRIFDPNTIEPSLASLIIGMEMFNPPEDKQHFVAPGELNGVPFFLVIIRVKQKTTSYLGAFMPIPHARSEDFFSAMKSFASKREQHKFNIPIRCMYT